MSRLIFVAVGAVAAWRLRATPLLGVSAVFAVSGLVLTLITLALERGDREASSVWITALGHICSAMGGFFLFVSFAM